MRWLKRGLLGLLAVVAIAVAAAVIFVSAIDFNEYKAVIAAELKAATGREVTIGGRIETSLLSTAPVIVVNDLSIANTDWGTRKDMVVRVSLFPLILGRVNVKRMVAVEPDILLETDRSGRQNWVFAPVKAKSGETGSGPSLAFRELRIRRARIAYRDGTTGDIDRFGIDRLAATAKSMASPMRFDASGLFDGKVVMIKGRLGPPADLFSGRAVELAFNATLGRSDLTGNLVLQAQEKVSLKGAVRSDNLDTADFGAASKDPRIFGEDPLPVGLVRILDADIGFKGRMLRIGSAALTGVEGAIQVVDGVLTVSNLKAAVAGGDLTGALSLNATARPAKLSAKADLTGLSLKQLTPTVSGPMSLALDVGGVGDTPRAIAATLKGRTTLIGGPGRVANDGLVLMTFGIGSIQKLLTRGSVRAENVNCVVAHFDFAGGVGQSRVLVTDSARLTFLGHGTLDLRSEQLNLLFVPRTKETGLGDVTIHPVRVTGSILNPSAAVDPSAAAKQAAKNILGSARRGLNFVGSLVGVTKRESRNGSPCRAAIAAAGGKAPAADGATERLGGSGGAPARPRKKKGLLQRLNPFD